MYVRFILLKPSLSTLYFDWDRVYLAESELQFSYFQNFSLPELLYTFLFHPQGMTYKKGIHRDGNFTHTDTTIHVAVQVMNCFFLHYCVLARTKITWNYVISKISSSKPKIVKDRTISVVPQLVPQWLPVSHPVTNVSHVTLLTSTQSIM